MIKYKSGYKYVLAETYACKISITGYFAKTDFIILDTNGNLVIKQNYAWDGATFFPDLEIVKRPSLIHDALCQLIRLGIIPEKLLQSVHRVMKEQIEEDIKCLEITDPVYLIIPELIYRGLVFSGKIGEGCENQIKKAPDIKNKKTLVLELIDRVSDIKNYL